MAVYVPNKWRVGGSKAEATGRGSGEDRVLIFLAEKDHLRGVGGSYHEDLKNSEWVGRMEVVEHEGEEHVFHLMKPDCEKAIDLVNKFATFINQE